jgi:hypothetical protein
MFGGQAVTGTVSVQLVGQPSRVILSVSVYDPERPAVTMTVSPVIGPTMLPEPLMDQLWTTTPPGGRTVLVYVLPVERHGTGLGPVMLQVGVGLNSSVPVQLVTQPTLSVTLAV